MACQMPMQVPRAGAPTMQELNLDFQCTDRLLNSMMFCLGPYLDENSLADKPWLMELAESYNEIVAMIPASWKLEHHQILEIYMQKEGAHPLFLFVNEKWAPQKKCPDRTSSPGKKVTPTWRLLSAWI
jgi:hypothetical protein